MSPLIHDLSVSADNGRKVRGSNGTNQISAWACMSRSGGSFFLIVNLFWLFYLTHLMAFWKAKLSLALVDDRTIGEIRLIHMLQENPWVAGVYFAGLLGVWCLLALRSTSRWNKVLCFGLLCLPCLLYVRACLHISNKLLGLPQG
jgi:hypothetical protein